MVFMAETETEQLLETIGILRTHCAWTRALTHQSLRTYLVEEVYEVIDAIGAGNPQELRDELGDLLLQIVLHAQIASEAGQFGFDDVANGLRQKMLRRNRHIFDEHGELRGDITQDVATIIETWDAAKAEEQRGRRPRAGLPAGLPALTLSQKLLSRQARAGRPVAPEHQGGGALAAAVNDEQQLAAALMGLTARASELGLDAEAVLRDALTARYAQPGDDTSSPETPGKR